MYQKVLKTAVRQCEEAGRGGMDWVWVVFESLTGGEHVLEDRARGEKKTEPGSIDLLNARLELIT